MQADVCSLNQLQKIKAISVLHQQNMGNIIYINTRYEYTQSEHTGKTQAIIHTRERTSKTAGWL